jgi:hypothetical protein
MLTLALLLHCLDFVTTQIYICIMTNYLRLQNKYLTVHVVKAILEVMIM